MVSPSVDSSEPLPQLHLTVFHLTSFDD
jgi:hypothetical protein